MGSKQETAKMVSDRLTPNTKLVQQTKKDLKRKGIISPDLSKMPYWIEDRKSKARYFFTNEERFRAYLKRITKDRMTTDFNISHPQLLCRTTISVSEK